MSALDWKEVFRLVNDWRLGYLPPEAQKGESSKTRLQRCKNQFKDKDAKHGSADKIENKGTSA
jgi:hypothetical protein